jgi:hypothetical protein
MIIAAAAPPIDRPAHPSMRIREPADLPVQASTK